MLVLPVLFLFASSVAEAGTPRCHAGPTFECSLKEPSLLRLDLREHHIFEPSTSDTLSNTTTGTPEETEAEEAAKKNSATKPVPLWWHFCDLSLLMLDSVKQVLSKSDAGWLGGSLASVAAVVMLAWAVELCRVQLQAPTLSTTGLPLQSLNLVQLMIMGVDLLVLVPTSYDLCLALGYGATSSGLLLGIPVIANSFGGMAGKLLLQQCSMVELRRCIVCSMTLTAVLEGALGVLLLMSKDGLSLWVLLGIRFAAGFLMGIETLISTVLANFATASDNMGILSCFQVITMMFGFSLGPLLNYLCSPGHRTALETSAACMLAMAFLWAVAAVPSAYLMPDQKYLATRTEAAGEEHWFPQSTCKADRQTFVFLALCYSMERNFTVTAAEVSTSLILEIEYGWSPRTIALVMGLVLSVGMVLLSVVFILLLKVRNMEISMIRFTAFFVMLGLALFFDYGQKKKKEDYGRSSWAGAAIQLLCADILVMFSAHMTFGIMRGIGINACLPGTWYAVDNFHVIFGWSLSVARFGAAPLARTVVVLGGRNLYASLQALVGVMGLWTSIKAARMLAVCQLEDQELKRLNEKTSVWFSRASFEAALTFRPRSDDYVVVGPPKCGNTWLQQMMHALRQGPMNFAELTEVVPFVDGALDQGWNLDAEQVATPRLFKTHLSEPHCPKGAKYVFIIREPLDATLSWFLFNEGWFFEKGSLRPDTYLEHAWLKTSLSQDWSGSSSFASIWDHIVTWWPRRNDDDVMWIFYEDMWEEPSKCAKSLATFMGLDGTDADLIETAVELSSLEYMKANRSQFDDHLAKAIRNPRVSMKADAGTSNANGKVSQGGSGRGSKSLSASVKHTVAMNWEMVVQPVTGCDTYKAMRDTVRRERAEGKSRWW